MKLSKQEELLFDKILEKKNIGKKKWENEILEKKKAEFLIGFTNPKSEIKKEWDEEQLIKAKKDLILDSALNVLNDRSNDNVE